MFFVRWLRGAGRGSADAPSPCGATGVRRKRPGKAGREWRAGPGGSDARLSGTKRGLAEALGPGLALTHVNVLLVDLELMGGIGVYWGPK